MRRAMKPGHHPKSCLRRLSRILCAGYLKNPMGERAVFGLSLRASRERPIGLLHYFGFFRAN